MLIACKCLNIQVKSIADNQPTTTSASITDYDDITISAKTSTIPSNNQSTNMVSSTNDNLEDNRQEQSPYIQDSTADKLNADQLQFFKTAKQLIETIVEPTIQHPSLVNIETIGNWILHSCRHCKVISHAQSANSVKILINPLLWTNSEKINSLKMQKNYSKSFNMLLMSAATAAADGKQVKSIVNGNIRAKQLRQYLNDAVQSETEATEERIDQYAKQQMALLQLYRDQAEKDFQNILRALDENVPNPRDSGNEANNDVTLVGSLGTTKLLSDLTPPVTPDSTPMSIGNSPNFKQQPSFLLLSQNPIQKKLPPKPNHSKIERSMVDRDDIFFDMDGLDGFDGSDSRDAAMPESTQSDDEDIDNDDQDFDDSYISNRSGIKITPGPRKSNSKVFVAQSLPMAVPIYNQRNDDDYEDYSDQQNNVDIAASIKALAKSVHGEAIFGDLPKPRFSTQI